MGQVDLNALAHEVAVLKNNFNQYVAGNTYNDVALTVTGPTIYRTFFRPYKTIDGSSHLFANLSGTAGASTTMTFTVPGILARNSEYLFPGYIITDAPGIQRNAYIIQNTNIFVLIDANNFTKATAIFDIELVSWPTWAYAI
jgi:hypothetical protein